MGSDIQQGGIRAFVLQNKAEVAVAIAAVVLVAVAVAGYFADQAYSLDQQRAELEEFRGAHDYRYLMGDVIELDSSKDDEGAYGSAHFDWKGTMEVSLTSAVVYDSPSAAGMTDEDSISGLPMGEQKFVLCELRLRNVDAEARFKYSDLGDRGRYVFNSSLFRLESQRPNDTRGCISPAYGHGLMVDPPLKGGYLYELEPGEEKVLKLGYFVPESSLTDGYVLHIGSSTSHIVSHHIALELEA